MYLLVLLHRVVILKQLAAHAAPEPLTGVRRRDVSLELRVLIEPCRTEATRKRVMHVMFGLKMYVELEHCGGGERTKLTLVLTHYLVAIVIYNVIRVHQARVERGVLHADVADLTLLQHVAGHGAVLTVLLSLLP